MSDSKTSSSTLAPPRAYTTAARFDMADFQCLDTAITIVPSFNLPGPLSSMFGITSLAPLSPLPSPPSHLSVTPLGPFEGEEPSQVPLWLALDLKKRGLCTIQWPSWLTVTNLTNILTYERAQANYSEKLGLAELFYDPELLPFHAFNIARQILSIASSDSFSSVNISDEDYTGSSPHLQIPPLLSDIEDLRTSKIRLSLRLLSEAMEDESSTPPQNTSNDRSEEAYQRIPHVEKFLANEINLFRPIFADLLRGFWKLGGDGGADLEQRAMAMSAGGERGRGGEGEGGERQARGRRGNEGRATEGATGGGASAGAGIEGDEPMRRQTVPFPEIEGREGGDGGNGAPAAAGGRLRRFR